MNKVIAVGIGGMIGTLLRAAVYSLLAAGSGLWAVNLLGSFLLGFLSVRLRGSPAHMRLFFSTGLLGSFTTFSAFSAEWFRILDASFLKGIIYGAAMTACAILSAVIGMTVARKGKRQ